MTIAEAKLRRAAALLTNALRGAAYGSSDLERKVHGALHLVFEAAVREAKGLNEPPPTPRAPAAATGEDDEDDEGAEHDGADGDGDDADEEE
jgi:hypothetical protein